MSNPIIQKTTIYTKFRLKRNKHLPMLLSLSLENLLHNLILIESPIFEIEKKKSFDVVQRDKDWYEGVCEGHKTRQEMKKKNYGLS